MGGLITSVKRGHAGLGENYAAHPKHLLKAILCLGLLLCISSDSVFEQVVVNISELTAKGGVVITRDCLTDAEKKIYMAFGGVIRNERDYITTFQRAGFDLLEENCFVIEQPIHRKIKSVIWKKR